MERWFNQASDGRGEAALFASLEALRSERCGFYPAGTWFGLSFCASVMDLASDEPVLIAIPKVLIPRSIAIGATVEIIGAATAAAPAPAIAIITLSYIN